MIKISYGYVTIDSTQRYENGKIVLGFIHREFNRDGVLQSTKTGDTMSVGYDNKPMSLNEANRLMNSSIGSCKDFVRKGWWRW